MKRMKYLLTNNFVSISKINFFCSVHGTRIECEEKDVKIEIIKGPSIQIIPSVARISFSIFGFYDFSAFNCFLTGSIELSTVNYGP